jgi:polyhydroxyalkanoate synthesis regulator phasin
MAKTDESGNAERRSAKRRMSEGIKEGIGVLAAFKDALEETIQEARERGDFSPDRAKGVMKDALGKAQAAATGAREKLDFAHQAELESLEETVKALRTRVAALEERVFGASAQAREEAPESSRNTGGDQPAP